MVKKSKDKIIQRETWKLIKLTKKKENFNKNELVENENHVDFRFSLTFSPPGRYGKFFFFLTFIIILWVYTHLTFALIINIKFNYREKEKFAQIPLVDIYI